MLGEYRNGVHLHPQRPGPKRPKHRNHVVRNGFCGRSNGCTSWSPSDAGQIIPIVKDDPTTVYICPEAADTDGRRATSGGWPVAVRRGLYWSASCLKEIDRSIILLGANDERHYGVDSTKQSYYRDGLRNLVGWLALSKTQTARSVGGDNGPWRNTRLPRSEHRRPSQYPALRSM
jgi:hypothetical protein